LKGEIKMHKEKENIYRFAKLLEDAGYDEGALDLIKGELIPLALERGISLWDAALEHADQDEEQDTSCFQLFHALLKVSPSKDWQKPLDGSLLNKLDL